MWTWSKQIKSLWSRFNGGADFLLHQHRASSRTFVLTKNYSARVVVLLSKKLASLEFWFPVQKTIALELWFDCAKNLLGYSNVLAGAKN